MVGNIVLKYCCPCICRGLTPGALETKSHGMLKSPYIWNARVQLTLCIHKSSIYGLNQSQMEIWIQGWLHLKIWNPQRPNYIVTETNLCIFGSENFKLSCSRVNCISVLLVLKSYWLQIYSPKVYNQCNQ